MSIITQWLGYPAAHDRILSMIGIEVHWAILQYVLGLPFMAFIAELLYLKTGQAKWLRLAKTLAKGFILVFAVGAATGTASEFGLVILWPNLLEAAGRYIYFPLYAEIFAFIMEVVFIYLLWYGWERLPKKVHAVITLLAFLGAWYSAAMIISVNSYMVAPTGIHAAYDPYAGWRYTEGYPKIELYVPDTVLRVLDVDKLVSLGMEVQEVDGSGAKVLMPVSIVRQLADEAWQGYKVQDSVLRTVLKPEYAEDQAVLQTPVKSLVDTILVATIKRIGIYTVTFKSPAYLGSLLHALGSGLTVSGFTVLAAYILRMAKMPPNASEEYRNYVESAYRFAAVFSLIVIALQGTVFGHELGTAVAMYNPEKFAAMEGTSAQLSLNLAKLLGAEKLMPLIAYGDLNAKLPVYDDIPENYCALPGASLGYSCRPPLIIHYLYYSKIVLGTLLGLYALLVVFFLWRGRKAPGVLVKLGLATPIAVQLVSFLGWATREIGRKPWTIYGVMTVDTAHTVNPPSAGEVVLVASFFIVVLAALAYLVWRLLWVPGREGV